MLAIKNNDKRALVVFAREPVVGKVKTRLLAAFDKNWVTALYKAFIKDTLNMAKEVCCEGSFVFYAGSSGQAPFLRRIKDSFVLKRQQGNDLGLRMYHAATMGFNHGFEKVIIIGTDCVNLRASDINTAFKKLDKYDCVLGPSRDGGYYLIGLKKPILTIFSKMPWSTKEVLAETQKRLRILGKRMYLLRRLSDIDTPADLKNLTKTIAQAPHAFYTKTALQQKRQSILCA